MVPLYIIIPEMVLKVLCDRRSRSNKSGKDTREYKKRDNYRIIIIVEEVLKLIPYITKY